MGSANYRLLIYKLFCLENFGEVRVQNLNQVILWESFCRKEKV